MPVVSYLLSVLSSGGVKALDEVGGVAQEHGVAGGATDHTQHGQPHVSQGLRGEPAVADTEHVGHGLGGNNRSSQRAEQRENLIEILNEEVNI